jgi:DEAD/DEAH box helicase domain-containing protein
MAATIATGWADLLEGEEIAYTGVEPAHEAKLDPLPDDLDPRVTSALIATGVTSLYRHQAEAWEAARRGENVVVTTGTASGKSLAFNLPVLDAIARDPKTRALYLYPTKALSQDQARSLAELRLKGLKPAIYDGDTPGERRWQIRKWSNVVLTNPDMLHVGVLPHHDRWGDVLANLRFVVVDEAHVYRGVFGSHVGNVLRRLRRLARIYDAEPQFLLATATIANPGELALELTGEGATVVDRDTSARAEREVVIWNPPLLDAELGLRASPLGDAARLLSQLTSRGLRTICFAKSRKAAELIHRFTVERVDAATAGRLAPYRAGYTAEQRRDIERRLVEGELLGVTATDALELGIDIGLLDCAISVGFPGTVASLRQQWGRAGRRDRGLAILVASDDALDQFFAREPDALLSRRVEAAILDHANPRILDPHVLAAAFEAPLTEGDTDTLGSEALRRAAELPELERTGAGYVWKGRDYPAARVSLRSGDAEAFTVVDGETGSLLGLVERDRAYSTVHEGAVYLHLGEQYLVESLSLKDRVAVVSSASVGWYTQAKKESETAIEESLRADRRLDVELHFGRVSVTEQVVGYARKAVRDGGTIDVVPMLMPETTFDTEAIWFCPEDEHLVGLEQMPRLLGALHAAEHSLIALLPLWAMCDRWDIGGLSTNVHYQTGRPTIFVYDGHTGGVGITERGFERFHDWVEDTARLLQRCPCAAGCPSCVQSPKCGNLNEPLDKVGARLLLERMLAA